MQELFSTYSSWQFKVLTRKIIKIEQPEITNEETTFPVADNSSTREGAIWKTIA